jgi:hypothetical protein
VPLPFFFELHKEQSKVVDFLAMKVDEAEKIAESILLSQESKSDSLSIATKEENSLRDKIFAICKMLMEQ